MRTQNIKENHSYEEELENKISELENKIKDLNNDLFIKDVQKKAYAEIAFQYGKQLNKSIGEVKFLEMVKEVSVVKGKHNPLHQTNIDFSEEKEELVVNYLSNKKYEFQNEFLPLFLSGQITMIGNRDYLYWFEAIDDWIVLAKKGNKDAMRNLIICFTNGYGVDKNSEYVNYFNKILNAENAQEPEFEEFFEINYKQNDEIEEKEIEVFNIDKNNLETDFKETEEYESLMNECKSLYKQVNKIPTIYIKQLPAIEKLVELSKEYEFLPYELRNEIFGATIALHNSQISFIVDNKKEHGSFLRKDKKADAYMKIANSTEWSCNLAVAVQDNLGNVFNSRCKINPGGIAQIALFSQHDIGSKIETVIFKTLEENSKTFIYQPKNWIVE